MTNTAADVAENAEQRQIAGEPDPFPPEGTDEASLDPDAHHVLTEDQRLKATRAVIKSRY